MGMNKYKRLAATAGPFRGRADELRGQLRSDSVPLLVGVRGYLQDFSDQQARTTLRARGYVGQEHRARFDIPLQKLPRQVGEAAAAKHEVTHWGCLNRRS